jgi:hypothetical protein
MKVVLGSVNSTLDRNSKELHGGKSRGGGGLRVHCLAVCPGIAENFCNSEEVSATKYIRL